MAERLGIALEAFIERYTHDMGVEILGRRRSLNEVVTEHGHDCVFLDRASTPGKALCSLHDARPSQCRTYPFWPENLKSPRAWQRTSRLCEGIGQGPLVPIDQIRIQVTLHQRDRASS